MPGIPRCTLRGEGDGRDDDPRVSEVNTGNVDISPRESTTCSNLRRQMEQKHVDRGNQKNPRHVFAVQHDDSYSSAMCSKSSIVSKARGAAFFRLVLPCPPRADCFAAPDDFAFSSKLSLSLSLRALFLDATGLGCVFVLVAFRVFGRTLSRKIPCSTSQNRDTWQVAERIGGQPDRG